MRRLDLHLVFLGAVVTLLGFVAAARGLAAWKPALAAAAFLQFPLLTRCFDRDKEGRRLGYLAVNELLVALFSVAGPLLGILFKR